MHEDASPNLLQQTGEFEVGMRGLAASPEPHMSFTFGQSVTLNGAADAQPSQSASPNMTLSYNIWM